MRILIVGGTGYIGRSVVRNAAAGGSEVIVLTRSLGKAEHLKKRGISAIVGDLLEDGEWQSVLKTVDAAIYLAAPPSWSESTGRISKARAKAFGDGHLKLTKRFLDSVPSTISKVIYIAGSSYFGDTGVEAKTESYAGVSEPKGWGPYIRQSVELLPQYIAKGIPIVVAFPSQVYGPESWTEQLFLKPISTGNPVFGLLGYAPIISPIHVDDCALACLFLVSAGLPGESYLLTDCEPMAMKDLMRLCAKALEKSPTYWSLPKWLCNLAMGPVLTEYATAHNSFSNKKLLEAGFKFKFETAREGIPIVVKDWKKKMLENQ
ncbi:hypothetical protein HDU83_007846 [Entophlyctis luteolus]|nr:hypothetical protein HDU82_008771 [Entophlyctis luteolus]KAJ3338976.1 hypothetical protein HDU83_007846 [Entophlyctis luteolus]KAJ3378676.1 hypothetical protein HDU84_007388 [Entophlyctis sp. JEL0112]